MPGFRTAVFSVLTGVLGIAAAVSAQDGILTSSVANAQWRLGDRPDELVFSESGEALLQFNKSAFADGEITLDIVTDGLSMQVFSPAGQLELRFLPAKSYKLGLNTDPQQPGISFQGAPLRLQAAEWERIVKDPLGSTFSVLLNDAKKVEIKFKSRGKKIVLNPPKADAPPAVPADPSQPVSPLTPVPAVPVDPGVPALPQTIDPLRLQQLRQAVFHLRIPTAHEKAEQLVPAFFISKLGYALAPLGPLRFADQISARFGSLQAPVPVEVWAVAPELGVAMVRVNPVDLALAGIGEPLELEKEKPGENDGVWTLTPPGPAAETGGRLLNGARFRDLTPTLVQSLGFGSATRWLNATIPVTPETAGMPVVNARGRVVGLAALGWQAPPREGEEPSSWLLYAGELQKFVDEPPLVAATLSAAKALQGRNVPTLAFPRLEIRRDMRSAQFHQSMAPIQGVMRQIAGRQNPGVDLIEGLHRTVCTAAETAALIDPQDPGLPAIVEQAGKNLDKFVREDPSNFTAAVNFKADQLLRSGQVKTGTAVVLIGRVVAAHRVAGLETGHYFVSFQTTRRQVLVRRPQFVGNLADPWVLAGGFLAGSIEDEEGEPISVIEGGMLLNVPTPAGTPINP